MLSFQMSPATVQFLLAGNSIRYFIAAALFIDGYLVAKHHSGILAADLHWSAGHLGPGDIFEASLVFFVFAILILPWLQLLLSLPAVVLMAYRAHSDAQSSEKYLVGIRPEHLRNYAVIQDNAVAYQEYIRHSQEVNDWHSSARSYFLLSCSLILGAWANVEGSDTLMGAMRDLASRLHVWIYYLLIGMFFFYLLIFFVGSLASSRYYVRYGPVSPRLYELVNSKFLPADLEEKIRKREQAFEKWGISKEMLERLDELNRQDQ